MLSISWESLSLSHTHTLSAVRQRCFAWMLCQDAPFLQSARCVKKTKQVVLEGQEAQNDLTLRKTSKDLKTCCEWNLELSLNNISVLSNQ